MFICGSNFVGGNLACTITPNNIPDINYIALMHGKYDDLYVTKKTDMPIQNRIYGAWDFDTILYAKFNNNTNAGNVDWNLETVSTLLLKKRVVGDFQWITILAKPVIELSDFDINYYDYIVANQSEIEYAIVPVMSGAEGIYSIAKIKVDFSKMFITEGTQVISATYGTGITDGFCNTTRNIPSGTVELHNHKYPQVIKNTLANYDTGVCSGSFVPYVDEQTCELAFGKEYDYFRTTYQKAVIEMICNGVPKVLKLPDGKMWIIKVTGLTDSAQNTYNNRIISFNWTEVGDTKSEYYLYYLGLSDVTEEWWNR